MATSKHRRVLPGAVASAALVLAPFAALSQNYSEYGHPHWGGGWGWGSMIFGPLMMIVFLAVAVVVVVLVVRWIGGWHHAPAAPGRAPLDILKERFARGEIDSEEYEQRRRTLGE